MMEISEIRKRLRLAIDGARRAGEQRRARVEAATRAYNAFLSQVATPVFKMFANALTVEGFPFTVFTPAGSVRLVKERSDDHLELALETGADPPVVIGRISRTRGRRIVQSERPLREHAGVEVLTEEDVLAFLLAEIPSFVAR